MSKQYYLIFLILIAMISCARVTMYAPGKYMASCDTLMSDESCKKEATDNCPHGYKVIYTRKDPGFRSRKYVAVGCSDQIENDRNNIRLKTKETFSKLREQGYVMSTKNGDVFAEKNGKKFRLTDSKYLCDEAEFDLGGAEAKGYAVTSHDDEFFLEKGDRKILLSNDQKHICRRI